MISTVFWTITSIGNTPAVIHKDENQPWKGFSVFLHAFLPIAGLALLWGRREIFSKLLLQLDRSCVSVYCPFLSKREKMLKWASNRLPMTWSSQARTLSSGIPELWKDGSLLCTIVNSVVPGACRNPHRHWRKPPVHAQALAYKYLGLVPMFTESDFLSEFTINQERNFMKYLHKLQEATKNWPTKHQLNHKFSSQYVARGMGLCTGEQHRQTIFYVYSSSIEKKRCNVLMYIRGPYGTTGTAIISPFHNLKTIPVVNVLQNQLQATKTLPFKNEEQKSFLKTISLDFTSLISNVEVKEEKNDIPIQIDMEVDRAKITYIPNDNGIYEISLICDGELLKGSPYIVQITKNTTGKKDSLNSNYENVEGKITFIKRKILFKVIDCIDEKIYISRNKLSKIKKHCLEHPSESENDGLTIPIATRKKDQILKPKISCSLEDILKDINLKGKESGKPVATEQLKTEIPNIFTSKDTNQDKTDNLKLQINTQNKLIKDCNEVKAEIINLLEVSDEVDKFHYNVERDQYVKLPEETVVSKLDLGHNISTENIRDFINSSSKEKTLPRTLLQRENDEDKNNNILKIVPFKQIKSKIYLAITPKLLASAICLDHIVPEVEQSSLNQLTLSDKRKTLSRQDSVDTIDEDVPLSLIENGDLSKSKHSSFRELSVLNVLDSLKQLHKESLSESSEDFLTSTVSIPNKISSDSNYKSVDESTFKTRKDYWERLSSRSLSNVSLTHFEYGQKKKKKDNTSFQKTASIEECLNNERDLIDKTKKVLRSWSEEKPFYREKIDTSLEDCLLISLEERKKQLLKEMYLRETCVFKKVNPKLNFFKKNCIPKGKKDEAYVSSIPNQIQTFDRSAQEKNKINVSPIKDISDKTKKISSQYTIKSPFKKTVNFFTNLEEAIKLKKKKYKNLKRSSFDDRTKNHPRIRGGSLNLPCRTDGFSVNNLY